MIKLEGVGDSRIKFENVRSSSREFGNVGENWMKFERVRESSSEFEKL